MPCRYSLAYAEYQLAVIDLAEGEQVDLTAADQALQRAIIRFPHMVTTLADKCGAVLKPEITGDKFFDVSTLTNGLRILLLVYSTRCHALWKAPAVLDWVQRNALAVLANASATTADIEEAAKRRSTHYSGVPKNIARHVIVSECDEARALFPPSFATKMGSVSDPVPPEGIKSVYDELLAQQDAANSHDLGAVEMFLRSLIPGFEESMAAITTGRGARGGGGGGAQGGGAQGGNDDAPAATVQEQLGRLVDAVGMNNLVEMLTAEPVDDGGPDPDRRADPTPEVD